MQKNIETIIFDFGGVLIDWNPRHLYRKIFDKEEEIEYFLTKVATPDWNEQQDAGRLLSDATEILIAQHPNYQTQIEAFYGRWSEMLAGPIHGTVEILKTLSERGDHRLYGLTNWSHETFPVAQKRYDFLKLFEGILVSGEEKIKKPDPQIYRLLLDRYNIDPTTAIFIDDSVRNVKASNDVGLPAIQFTSAKQLKKDLVDRGIKL